MSAPQLYLHMGYIWRREKKSNDWRQTGPAAAFNSPLCLLLKCSFAQGKRCFIAAKILRKDMALGA